MAREEIEIEIGPSGKVTARTIGIKGSKCIDVADMLVRIIGREESRELTSEFYEAQQEVDQQVEVRDRHR